MAAAVAESFTPLHFAALENHTDVIEVLLGAGANVDIQDTKLRTPLMVATTGSHIKAIELLIDAGSKPNKTNARGHSALFAASNVEVAKVLIDRGASAKVVDVQGWTLLHNAAFGGYPTGLLCAHFKAGANPLSKDARGRTPADIARLKGNEGTARMLDMLAAKHRELNA